MSPDRYQVEKKLQDAIAGIAYHIVLFGDHLAKREGYKRYDGIDAVHFYLVQKYGWLPSVVKALSTDDLHFLLTEDMADWQVPLEART